MNKSSEIQTSGIRKGSVRSTWWKKGVLLLASIGLAMTLTVPSALAAGFELSITGKKMLDQTVSSSGSAMSSALRKQESRLKTLHQQDQSVDQQIRTIYYANKESETRLLERLRQHEAAQIDKLTQDVTSTKKRYEPLFALYSSLNKELTLVRKLKNKNLTAAVKSQVDSTKVAVTLAKEEIKRKQDKLTAAKKARDAEVKKVRTALAQKNPVQVQIRATKSNISAAKKRFTQEMKNFNVVAKKKEGTAVLSSITALCTIAEDIVRQKEEQYKLESKVKQVIAGAGKLL